MRDCSGLGQPPKFSSGALGPTTALGRAKVTIVLQLEHIDQVYLAIVLEFRHFDVKNMTQKAGRHPPGAVRGRRHQTAIEQVPDTVEIDRPTQQKGLHGELQKSHAHQSGQKCPSPSRQDIMKKLR